MHFIASKVLCLYLACAGNEFDPHWCVDWQLDEAFLYCAGKGTTICSLQDRLKEDEYVTTIFQWQNMCYIFMAFFFFWLAKHLYRLPYLYMLKGLEGRKSEFKTGNKLIYKSNAAVAISFTGYVMGLAMIFVAAIEDLDQVITMPLPCRDLKWQQNERKQMA